MTEEFLSNAEQSGNELRNLTAKYCREIYEKVEVETRLFGKKIDVIAKYNNHGKEITYLIECKDYERALTRDKLVNIVTDLIGIAERYKPSHILVVTRNGLTADAEQFVKEKPELIHSSIWELEQKVLGLREYAGTLEKLFTSEGLDRYYIPTAAREQYIDPDNLSNLIIGDRVDLFSAVNDWIYSDDIKPIAILGGYGAGKSSFAARLVSYLASETRSKPEARFPVLIKLGAFSSHNSLIGILGEMFTSEHVILNYSFKRFLSFNAEGRFVIVLDGFDEMKHAMSWTDFKATVEGLNALVVRNSKVILLGRPSAFTSESEHEYVLRGRIQKSGNWIKIPGWPTFCEYIIDNFSDDERRDFVKKYITFKKCGRDEETSLARETATWVEGRANDVTKISQRFQDLFSKPVHTRILVDLAVNEEFDLQKFSSELSRWKLYESFLYMLFDRETKKAARKPLAETARADFLKRLAVWLWTERAGHISFAANDIPRSLIKELEHGDIEQEEVVKREYLTGAFLEKKSGDLYYFGHRSFAEFLVALWIYEDARDPKDHVTASSVFKDGVAEFLKEAPKRAISDAEAQAFSANRGPLSIEYLGYMARISGSIDVFREIIGSGTWWEPVLVAIDNEFLLDDDFLEYFEALVIEGSRLKIVMSLNVCATVMRKIQPVTPRRLDFATSDFARRVWTILLSGMSSGIRAGGGKGAISIEGDGPALCKDLLHAFFGDIETIGSGRGFRISFFRLFEKVDRILKAERIAVARNQNVSALIWPEEISLSLYEVTQALDDTIRQNFLEFFRIHKNFSTIVHVKSKPHTGRR